MEFFFSSKFPWKKTKGNMIYLYMNKVHRLTEWSKIT